jgi:hypothetical protein
LTRHKAKGEVGSKQQQEAVENSECRVQHSELMGERGVGEIEKIIFSFGVLCGKSWRSLREIFIRATRNQQLETNDYE